MSTPRRRGRGTGHPLQVEETVVVVVLSQHLEELSNIVGHHNTAVEWLAGRPTTLAMHWHVVLVLVTRCSDRDTQCKFSVRVGENTLNGRDLGPEVVTELGDVVVLKGQILGL